MIVLNEDEQDALRELLNIAYGHATSSISQILNAFATLHIPKIEIIPFEELRSHIKDKSTNNNDLVGFQSFNGGIKGQSMFLIDDQSSKNLTLHLYGETSSENIEDSVLELTNILSSSIMSKLSESFRTEINFTAPSVSTVTNANLINYEDALKYKNVIIITTMLEFQDISIYGEILIVTDDESLLKIKKAINEILESL